MVNVPKFLGTHLTLLSAHRAMASMADGQILMMSATLCGSQATRVPLGSSTGSRCRRRSTHSASTYEWNSCWCRCQMHDAIDSSPCQHTVELVPLPDAWRNRQLAHKSIFQEAAYHGILHDRRIVELLSQLFGHRHDEGIKAQAWWGYFNHLTISLFTCEIFHNWIILLFS